jgi:hypothetical protein
MSEGQFLPKLVTRMFKVKSRVVLFCRFMIIKEEALKWMKYK